MNFNYLNLIIKGESNKQDYTTYSLDSCLGGKNSMGLKVDRPHSKYKISFPKEVNNYTYDDYLNEFKDILGKNGHKSSERIIHVITYIFINMREKIVITDRAWKKFSSSMFTTCNLHLEYPMDIEYDSNEVLHLLRYDIGKFDVSTVKTKIREEANSNYWDKYHSGNENILSKLLSFRRMQSRITILNVHELVYGRFPKSDEAEVVCDLYFEALTVKWFEIFLNELNDEMLNALIFGGADFYTLLNPSFSPREGSRLAIFSRIKGYQKNGWVIPLTRTVFNYSFDTQRSISEVNNQLLSFYKSMSQKSEDFHSLIITYRRLFGNGMRLLTQENVEEAFMDMWIAMDTIFKRDSESNALKNRIAATTWYQSNTNHEIQYQTVSRLYTKRNKYVHSGFEVIREDAILMRDLCQIILTVLLNIHNVQIKNHITFKDWIKDIDESYNQFYKKQPVNIELLKRIGVIPEN